MTRILQERHIYFSQNISSIFLILLCDCLFILNDYEGAQLGRYEVTIQQKDFHNIVQRFQFELSNKRAQGALGVLQDYLLSGTQCFQLLLSTKEGIKLSV